MKFLAGVIVFLVLLITIQHLFGKIYYFQAPQPFQGEQLYNPYAQTEGTWHKANFHAHGKAHFGLTNGEQAGRAVLEKYESMGYDIAAISDYHSVNSDQNPEDPSFIPVYEHGYSFIKSHRLAIGSEQVSRFDLSLPLLTSHKQSIIDNLHQHTPVIALAHPKLNNGHSPDDLKHLTGYHLFEVLNHYKNSADYWDIALSAGKPVWLIANDDSHNIYGKTETGANWTMLKSPNTHRDAVLQTLRVGSAYGVAGLGGINDNALESVNIAENKVSIRFAQPADSILLIGQHGTIRGKIYNSAHISYHFQTEDTYIRAVAYNPKTTMYLNPVIRYDGGDIPANTFTASVSPLQTNFLRAGILFIYTLVFYFILGGRIIKLRVRRKPSLVLRFNKSTFRVF
ncbi:MAG: hypothetical protein GF372_06955 [Candidatus Marinimicrobia bacterium]|nr:hypothetical protein [Candidatus Neomarinimicrobiota bacterium]